MGITRYIYIDLLFAINLLADYLILYMTGRFGGMKARFLRMISASFVGSAVGTFVLCMDSATLSTLCLILLPPIMCFTAFGVRRIRTYLFIIFNFLLSSVLLYGGASAMYYFLSATTHFVQDKLSFPTTAFLLVAVCLAFILTSSLCSRSVKNRQSTVKAELFDGTRTYDLILLCDNGNFAKDPFSGMPVSIISKNSIHPDLIKALCGNSSDIGSVEGYSHIKPRVVPIKTVSGRMLLYAFVPEKMYIFNGRDKHSVDTIIAIDTRENSFYGKDGIIPSALLDTI